nr:O-antigen ligase family protein [Paenibacillus bovis]
MDYQVPHDKQLFKKTTITRTRHISVVILAIYIASVYIYASVPSTTFISEIIFIIFLISVLFILYNKGTIEIAKEFIWFYVFGTYLLLGSMYSPDINYSLSLSRTYFLLIVFIYLIVALLNTRILIEKMVFYFSIAGIVYSVYCINLYGIDGIINSLTTGVRLGYEVGAPNSYGYYGAISTVLLIYLFMTRGKKVYLIASILPLIIVITSYSKKAFIIFVLSTLILLFFKYRKRTFKMITMLTLFGIGIYFVLQIPELELLKNRITSLINILQFDTNESTESDQIRVKLIGEGIRIFLENPFIGHGTGAFRFQIIENIGHEMSSHNNFIELAVNNGLLGLFLFYTPIILIIIRLLRIYSKFKDELSILLFILLVNNTFINGSSALTYLDKISFVILGISYAYCFIFYQIGRLTNIKHE